MRFSNIIIQKQKLIFSTYFVGMITYNFVNAYHTGQKKLIEYRMKPIYVEPNTSKTKFPYHLYEEPNPADYYIESKEYEIVSTEIYNKSFQHFIDSLVFPFKITWDVIPYLVIILNGKTNSNDK
jgi:hypothetical protein